MIQARTSHTLDLPWTSMEPIRLGQIPAGLGTADWFVTVESDAQPLLRIDLYVSSDEAFAFEEARVCSERIVIGWGEHVYLVNPFTRRTAAVRLGSYFGHMYPVGSNVLVASAEHLFLISAEGAVLWQTEPLGIDGVIVNRVADDIIEGEGEWDPPGGWRPFSIRLHDGRPT